MKTLKSVVIVLDKIQFSKLGLISLAALSLSCSGKNEVSKPNVLFIMTDQQRADALGIAGNSILKTPNLDRLAKQGAYFRNTYTQCAVCAPARATILTGHTIENNGIRTNSIWKDEPDLKVMTMPTFDEILHENGYTCEYFGKWHCPEEPTRVYEKFVTLSDYKPFVNKHVPYVEPTEGQLISSESGRAYTPSPIDKHFGMNYKEVLELHKKTRFAQTELHGVSNIPSEFTSTAFICRQTNAMYDLNTDPHEMNNLLGSNPESSKYKTKAEELKGFLLEWLQKTDSKHYNGVKKRQI